MKKILLVCSAGMSTSILVKKMQEEAMSRSLEIEIEAISEAEVKNHKNFSIIMLGPQVRFLKSKFDHFEKDGIPVVIIDSMKYGRMDGKSVLDDALALIN